MIRTLGWQSAFNAGEIDPTLYGRIDITRYLKACRVLENKVPLVQGAAARRPGTLDQWAIKDQAVPARLAEFDFGDVGDTVQSYVLESGAGYLRIHDPVTGVLMAPASNLAITNGQFTSNITSWTVVATDGTTQWNTGAAEFITSLNSSRCNISQQVSGTASQLHVIAFKTTLHSLYIAIGTTQHASDIYGKTLPPGYHVVAFTMPAAGNCWLEFGVFGGGGHARLEWVAPLNNQVIELEAPWTLADLDVAMRAQSADTQFIATGGHAAQELRRYGSLSWSLVDAPFEDGPYLPENTDPASLVSLLEYNGAALGGPPDAGYPIRAAFTAPQLTASSTVGRLLRVGSANKWGYVWLDAFIDSQHATGFVVKKCYSTTFSAWKLGAFHPSSFPRSVSFYDNRLAWGGCNERPQTIYFSRPELPRDFAPSQRPATDSLEDVIDTTAGLTFTPASKRVAPIVWLHGARSLMIGTTGGTFTLDSGSTSAALGPTAVRAGKIDAAGCARRPPAESRESLMYGTRQRTGLLALTYNASVIDFQRSDLSLLSPSLLDGKLAQIHWQEKPWSVAWFHDDDGRLFSFTFDNSQEVTAFARHPLGGGGIVESLAIITRPEGDELWLIARRTVNGSTTRRIEKLALPWKPYYGEKWHFADAGKTVDRWNTNTAKTIATGGIAGAYTLTANDSANIAGVGAGGKVLLKRLLRQEDRAGGRRWYEHIIVDILSAASATVLNVNGTIPASWRNATFTLWAIGATTITGLSHLEGLAVKVNRDGVIDGPFTVTAGVATLTTAYGYASVGLAYTSVCEPVTLERQLPDGTSAGRSRHSSQITARLVDTLAGHFGDARKTLDPIKYEELADPTTQRQFWSGDIVLTGDSGWSAQSNFRLEQRDNAPMTISGLGDVAMIGEPNAAIPAGSI